MTSTQPQPSASPPAVAQAQTISVDIGGTFTDAWAVHRGHTVHAKAATTRYDLSVGLLDAVRGCADQLGVTTAELLSDCDLLRYATTLALNALLEHKGPRLGLLTTAGFEDTMFISRGAWHDGLPMETKRIVARARRPEPLIPRTMVVGLRERVDFRGDVVVALRREDVRRRVRELADRGAMGFVVSLLWSFLNPTHERMVRDEIESMFSEATLGAFPVILSSDVLPKALEYQRTTTTIISAYLHRDMSTELAELNTQLLRAGYTHPLWLVNNAGGCAPLHRSSAIGTYNAGPIGGLVGSIAVARAYGFGNVITTDMGGTSFDIGHGVAGESALKVAGSAYRHFYASVPTIGRWRVGISMIETTSIGAGGGSIASVSPLLDNLVEVGPRSAGSLPGPACFERGGTEATVTDADVVLGYIDPGYFLGGAMRLNPDLAARAVSEHVATPLGVPLQEAALSVRTVIDATMGNEIHKETNLKGLDPRRFVMFAFGGAGPTHAAGYARAVRVPRVVTFPQSSVFSAFGISTMAFTRVYERSRRVRLRQPGGRGWLDDFTVFNAAVDELLAESIRDAADVTGAADAVFRLELDMRYGMQPNVTRVQAPGLHLSSHEDVVALHERFTEEYGRIYSPAALYPQGGVDIENFAVWITIAMGEVTLPVHELAGPDPSPAWKSSRRAWFEDGWRDTPVYEETALRPGNIMDGPAIVEAVDTTIVVPPAWRFTKDRHGNGILEEVR